MDEILKMAEDVARRYTCRMSATLMEYLASFSAAMQVDYQ